MAPSVWELSKLLRWRPGASAPSKLSRGLTLHRDLVNWTDAGLRLYTERFACHGVSGAPELSVEAAHGRGKLSDTFGGEVAPWMLLSMGAST